VILAFALAHVTLLEFAHILAGLLWSYHAVDLAAALVDVSTLAFAHRLNGIVALVLALVAFDDTAESLALHLWFGASLLATLDEADTT